MRMRRSTWRAAGKQLGSRQAGARRLKARSNPRAEVVVQSDGLAPYLGNAERGTREGKSLSCARSDLHHLGRTESGSSKNGKEMNQPSTRKSLAQPQAWTYSGSQLAAAQAQMGSDGGRW